MTRDFVCLYVGISAYIMVQQTLRFIWRPANITLCTHKLAIMTMVTFGSMNRKVVFDMAAAGARARAAASGCSIT